MARPLVFIAVVALIAFVGCATTATVVASSSFGGATSSSSQPPETMTTQNAAHTRILRFNPCPSASSTDVGGEGGGGGGQLRMDAMVNTCSTRPGSCEFCLWVAMYDSVYRVNDVVSLLGPNSQISSRQILASPKFRGSLLQRMLSREPKDPSTGEILFPDYPAVFPKAAQHFNFLVRNLLDMKCDSAGSDTLVVHIRAGDNFGDTHKEADGKHVTLAGVQRMKDVVFRTPEIKRIHINTMMHFGVPSPQDKSGFIVASSDDKDDSPRFQVTDQKLSQNEAVLRIYYEAALNLGKEVWFTSHDDVDDDMCRYAKACHFFSATDTNEAPGWGAWAASLEAASESAMPPRPSSFDALIKELNSRLKQC